jgi:hypothetical protein
MVVAPTTGRRAGDRESKGQRGQRRPEFSPPRGSPEGRWSKVWHRLMSWALTWSIWGRAVQPRLDVMGEGGGYPGGKPSTFTLAGFRPRWAAWMPGFQERLPSNPLEGGSGNPLTSKGFRMCRLILQFDRHVGNSCRLSVAIRPAV